MKIVVIGGTGLIGSKVVAKLQERGYEAVPASPRLGVNTITGEGLIEALTGASVVVDVSNSPSFEDMAVMKFFTTSTGNLLAAEAATGVGHHVALSVVGTERLSESGYFRGKIAQEKLIRESGIPYTIVHATQFFEFVRHITDAAMHSGTTRVADVLIRPIAGDDVAAALVRTALGLPTGRMREIAGPEIFELGDLARIELHARHDDRDVVPDPLGTYFGARLSRTDLLPGPGAAVAPTRFRDWIGNPAEIVLPI